ncbi:hypothetical protein HYH02_001039 [Chlamydomonas schloesseri]|uniref:Citrate transporter-like domain-containing protein n=1 Tax=Chlamydomonas schloesseri TaxID=2026947 RepID=A0A836BC12_9CHLO|nr:hypothetical protein HYH02_001039 [Chlamydomonas schloesseri]|eukprot:KAG2453996.1 hypothetical protein HYH02_001039 [Chlamydomonas schloesseri]
MTDVGTFPAIAALVIFCLAIVFTLLLVFKSVSVTVPLPASYGRKPLRIAVKYYIAPVVAVLLMLACTCMSIQDVGRGLAGNDQIKPYGILVLFMSMAYIAGSLDATGIFAWMALRFTVMSGGRGYVLFLFYFVLSAFITTFTSNDVCILTLTPIVCYFAKATGVDPMPFLFAEYAAANTFGALLYTGNPTNIIVAQAYDMTFLGYSKYMTLPTLAAGLVTFLVLLLEFHAVIPRSIPLPTVDASHMIRDRLGAWFGSVNMLTCLALLAAAPTLGWEMWAITLVCGGVHAVFNLWPFRSSLTHIWGPLSECWTCGGERLGQGQHCCHEDDGKYAAHAGSGGERSAANGGGRNGDGSSGEVGGKDGKDGGWGGTKDLALVSSTAPPAAAMAGGAIALTPCATEPPAQPHASRSIRRKPALSNSGNAHADDPLAAPLMPGGGGGGGGHAGGGAVSAAAEASAASLSARNDSALATKPLFQGRHSASGMGSGAAQSSSRAVAEAAEEQGSEAGPAAAVATAMTAAARRPGPVAEATDAPPAAEPLLLPADAEGGDGSGRQALPATVAINVEGRASGGAAAPVASAAADAADTAAGAAAGAGAGGLTTTTIAMTVDDLRGGRSPTYWGLLFDLPWEVVPFALGMFVLVEGLNVQGWLAVFGSGLGDACHTLPAAVFIIGFLSVFLANTINNQPMTILLTRVLLSEQFTSRVGYGNTHLASLFSLVLASNIGAVFTLIGALAGILWSNILGLHGLRCSYLRFARVCCPVGLAALVAGLAVLWFEFGVFPHSS